MLIPVLFSTLLLSLLLAKSKELVLWVLLGPTAEHYTAVKEIWCCELCATSRDPHVIGLLILLQVPSLWALIIQPFIQCHKL